MMKPGLSFQLYKKLHVRLTPTIAVENLARKTSRFSAVRYHAQSRLGLIASGQSLTRLGL
jgi:hypothetical protein